MFLLQQHGQGQQQQLLHCLKLSPLSAAKTQPQSNLLLSAAVVHLRRLPHLQLQLSCLSSRGTLMLPPLLPSSRQRQQLQKHQSLHQQLMQSLRLMLQQDPYCAAVWSSRRCPVSSSSL
jgi:hypothetical protein